jgi:hypothetical protein
MSKTYEQYMARIKRKDNMLPCKICGSRTAAKSQMHTACERKYKLYTFIDFEGETLELSPEHVAAIHQMAEKRTWEVYQLAYSDKGQPHNAAPIRMELYTHQEKPKDYNTWIYTVTDKCIRLSAAIKVQEEVNGKN